MTQAMSEPRAVKSTETALPVVLDTHPESSSSGYTSRVEAAERRLAFLSDVGSVLGSSLNCDTTLSHLTRLAVPFLADWCAVYLVDEETTVRRVSVTHADPGKAGLAAELRTCLAPDPSKPHPALEAVRSGRLVLLPVLSDTMLQVIARDTHHLDVMRRMELRSAIGAPLMSQGDFIGAILFLTAESGRVYGPEDQKLAEDLAARTAMAVVNARLYQEANDARQKVEELNGRLQRSVVETHHRVKNNLQVVAAMIDSRLMDDRSTVSENDLRRLESCVRALAAVHDTLTQHARVLGVMEAVSTRDMLGRLVPLLQKSTPERELTLDVDDAHLSVRQSTSLALIVNELVSNALKHGKKSATVTLRVSRGTCLLNVSDDGDGFPNGFDPIAAANTGLALVETLSRWDLAGDIQFLNRPEGGADVRVSFPLAPRDSA